MLRSDFREVFNKPMLSSKMYPIMMFEDYLLHFEKKVGTATLKKCVQLSTEGQYKTLFGFSKIVPLKIMEKMVFMMWPKQITAGKLERVHV